MFWTAIFLLLGFELLTITFLIIPLPLFLRSLVRKTFGKLWEFPYWKYGTVIITGLIGSVVVSSFMDMSKYESHKLRIDELGAASLGEKNDILLKLFRSQRNLYLSFFTLFLMLVLYGFSSYIHQLEKANNELDALKKGAKKA